MRVSEGASEMGQETSAGEGTGQKHCVWGYSEAMVVVSSVR